MRFIEKNIFFIYTANRKIALYLRSHFRNGLFLLLKRSNSARSDIFCKNTFFVKYANN